MKNTLIICLLLFLMGCFGKEPLKTGHEGQEIPSFKLLLTDSTTILDTKDISNGKPFVFFQFGPHCPYSKAQMKDIIQNKYQLKDVNFYIITKWPYADMKNFYSEFEISKYPAIIMGQDTKAFFSSYFEIPGVPYLAVYGKDRKLIKAFIGKTSMKEIKDVIQN